MSNTRKNKFVIIRNDKPKCRIVYFKLAFLLFFSSLITLSPLSINASEQINITSKTDSVYYEGNYGKGTYWVTPGFYSSMFNIYSSEFADKPKKYFIYSSGHRSKAHLYQMQHKATSVKNKYLELGLRLPRKISLKISRTMQSKSTV